jgi:glycosyltransferase involved in cell wall biosynthesis
MSDAPIGISDPVRVLLVAERREASGGPAAWVHGLHRALERAGARAELVFAADTGDVLGAAATLDGSRTVVHTYSQAPGSLWLAGQARRRGIPVVHTIHGDLFAEQRTKRGIRRLLWLPFNQRALAVASRLTVPSAYLAQRLTATRPALADRMVVIPNGIDVGEVAAAPPLDRAELRVPDGSCLLSAVTTFTHLAKAEGVIPVCEAVGRLRADGLPVELRIAGEGRLRQQIQRRCATDGIEFLGFVPEADRLIAASDVFVHSSGLDVFAYVVLEAFALGVPTIVTPVGGIPELVGDAGQQVPPGDAPALAAAIASLLGDRSRAAALGARGAARAAAFDWARLVRERWLPLYEESLT